MNVQSIKIDRMPHSKQRFEEIRKNKRTLILGAALEVFAKEGYHASTVGAIAKKAGISQGLMYNYFKSKEDLVNELVIGMVETLMCEFTPINPKEKVTRDHVVNFINVGIDLVLKDPAFWKMYFSVFLQPDVFAMVIDRMMALSNRYMKAMAKYFKEKGEKDPLLMMRYFSAIMDGVQMHIMLDPKNFPAEKVKKLLIQQFA
jgi:AcrR family transcriptional regulator